MRDPGNKPEAREHKIGSGQSNKKSWWQPGLILFGRLSGWIVGPVIIALFVGTWLDRKFDTRPWLFLLAVGLSFLISIFGIVKEGMESIKEIEKR
jgi:F0F1-type ATP synthase assembly protein I